MGSAMMTMFMFVGVMALAALVFSGWLAITLLKLIGRGVGFLMGRDRYVAAEMLPGSVERRCANPACRTRNPVSAQFCRRCGRPLVVMPGRNGVANQPPRLPMQVGGWGPASGFAAGERNRI